MGFHLLSTTIIVEAGGPDTTPRSHNFRFGIPYLYSFNCRITTMRGERPPSRQLEAEPEAAGYRRLD